MIDYAKYANMSRKQLVNSLDSIEKRTIEFVKSKFELTKELKTIDKEPTLLNQNFTKGILETKTLNNKPKINEKAKSKQNDSYGMSM